MVAIFCTLLFAKNWTMLFTSYNPVITRRDELEKDVFMTSKELKTMLLYFISQLEVLDIWDLKQWEVIPLLKQDIDGLKADLLEAENIEPLIDRIILLWHHLSNLGTMYEEVQREWFLPKMFAVLFSDPNPPSLDNV